MTSQSTGLLTKLAWSIVTALNFASILRSGCPAVGIGVNVGDKSGCCVSAPFGPSTYTVIPVGVPLTVYVAPLIMLGKTTKKYLQLIRSKYSPALSPGLLGPKLPFALMSITSVPVPTEFGNHVVFVGRGGERRRPQEDSRERLVAVEAHGSADRLADRVAARDPSWFR